MKMKKSIFSTKYIWALGTIMFLALAGCLTPRPPLKLSEADKPIKIVREEGLVFTARFLDDETLIVKFGDRANPFISDYTSLMFRRFIVFELSIKNTGSEPVMFQLNRLELQFAGKSLFAYNRFRINQYWEFEEEDARGIEKAKRERLVNENVLPDSIKIPSPGELKGYAVFTGNTPEYGTATLFVPLFSEDGRMVHRFEVSFEF
jgi:hypothetical protein